MFLYLWITRKAIFMAKLTFLLRICFDWLNNEAGHRMNRWFWSERDIWGFLLHWRLNTFSWNLLCLTDKVALKKGWEICFHILQPIKWQYLHRMVKRWYCRYILRICSLKNCDWKTHKVVVKFFVVAPYVLMPKTRHEGTIKKFGSLSF